MNPLIIQEEYNIPYIHLDLDKGVWKMRGKCFPENTREFFKPVLQWIKQALEQAQDQHAILNFDFSYINSSTSQMLYEILELFQNDQHQKLKVKIIWYYTGEYEYYEEMGKDLQKSFLDLDFSLCEKKKNI